jgi:acetyl-CoA carboxylase biotin carboxyl carrier protein
MMKKSKRTNGDAAVALSLADIEQVLAFMEKHGLEELAYERAGIRIHLRKTPREPAGGFRALSVSEAGTSHAAPSSSAGKERAAEPVAAHDVHVIKSPIVGTFYAAPGPDTPPFVSVGQGVDRGQVLCIIEAMKLMNEIESEVAGEVAQVLVENGHPVEYGQPLFGIRVKTKK